VVPIVARFEDDDASIHDVLRIEDVRLLTCEDGAVG
jgi:hypothetical protein